jgi:hypothetical protein
MLLNKKIVYLAILIIGTASAAFAADQIFFELNAGIYFYPGAGGKIGWIHYWKNEKIGFTCDVSYYNNGFVDEIEGNWKEEIKKAHNWGLAAGILFNNMGMNGVFRTSEYIKLKGMYAIWDKPGFLPYLDVGFKLNIFFSDRTALAAGIGLEMLMIPYPYLSLGMTFTL